MNEKEFFVRVFNTAPNNDAKWAASIFSVVMNDIRTNIYPF